MWRCPKFRTVRRSWPPAAHMKRRSACSTWAIEQGAMSMTIRLGANPIGWSNDDMQELGGWIPLEECLTDAKAAGFEGMELGNKFPRQAAKLGPILNAYGLDLIGGWHSIFLLERDAE